MGRTPSCDKSGLRKGTWTPEEDKKLVAYVTRYGYWNWRLLPKFAGLARCGKSCRLRWMNYLRPDIKRGDYTQEEEETIIRLHEKLGNRWSVIAANLPGRTDNEIKNHWHTTLKKRFEHKSDSDTRSNRTGKARASKSKNHGESPILMEGNDDKQMEGDLSADENSNIGPMSPQPSSTSGFSCVATEAEAAARKHENNFVPEDDDLAFLHAYNEPVSADFWTEPYVTDVSYVPPHCDDATVPLVHEPEYFSPIWDVEFWTHNSSLYQECDGGFFYY